MPPIIRMSSVSREEENWLQGFRRKPLWFKLLGGSTVQRICYGVLSFVILFQMVWTSCRIICQVFAASTLLGLDKISLVFHSSSQSSFPATWRSRWWHIPARKYNVWMRGSILAPFSIFQQMYISKGESPSFLPATSYLGPKRECCHMVCRALAVWQSWFSSYLVLKRFSQIPFCKYLSQKSDFQIIPIFSSFILRIF